MYIQEPVGKRDKQNQYKRYRFPLSTAVKIHCDFNTTIVACVKWIVIVAVHMMMTHDKIIINQPKN